MTHHLRQVASVAALRAIKDHHDDQLVLVLASGSEEMYYFVPTATNADDGQVWIQPTDILGGNPGRWKLFE